MGERGKVINPWRLKRYEKQGKVKENKITKKMLPFGKVDPKKMHDMLRKMGVKSKDIEADEVIIKQGDKKLIIRDPKISEVEFSGQKTFQIHGNITEIKESDEIEIKEKDINFVEDTAKVTKEKAREALEKTKGDIAKAILILKQ